MSNPCCGSCSNYIELRADDDDNGCCLFFNDIFFDPNAAAAADADVEDGDGDDDDDDDASARSLCNSSWEVPLHGQVVAGQAQLSGMQHLGTHQGKGRLHSVRSVGSRLEMCWKVSSGPPQEAE